MAHHKRKRPKHRALVPEVPTSIPTNEVIWATSRRSSSCDRIYDSGWGQIIRSSG
jgi:hypothetical protein